MKKKLFLSLVFVMIFVFAISSVYVWFIWLPQQTRTAFENHYFDIMKNVNSTETKTEVIRRFERDYNFTEIYEWVNEKLEFVPMNASAASGDLIEP